MKKLLVVMIPEDVLDDLEVYLNETKVNKSITVELLLREMLGRVKRAKTKTE